MLARIVSFCIVITLAWPALAVKPGQWTHQTEADFAAGELTDVIVTNLGDVRLARASRTAAELSGEDSIVHDLERLPDGQTFAAIGPLGKLARLDGGELTVITSFERSQVFAMAPAAGKAEAGGLWVAISGEPSRLELRGGPDMAVQRTIELSGVRYIWDLLADGDRLWLATGVEGKVLAIDTSAAEPQPVIALDSPHSNLLCLGIDGRGRVYVGSDGEGIVYRITPRDGGGYDGFALYDAPEPEIGALLVLKDGTLYAGTADVEQAKPGRLEQAQSQQVGRVEPPMPGDIREKVPNVPPKPEPKPKDEAEPQDGKAKGQAGSEPVEVADASAPAQPTPEQYDLLRAAVRQRLEQARQTGEIKLQSAPMPAAPPASPAGAGPGVIRSRTSGQPAPATSKKGNAIYRISPEGFVREVFRESLVVLRLIPGERGIYAATGNEGELYHIDPEAEEVTLLARLEPKQLPALWAGEDGTLLIGAANPGRVVQLEDRYSDSGTLRSAVLDASQISLWGKLTIAAAASRGTGIEVQTRSGNVNNDDDGAWWSAWSPPQPVQLDGLRSGYLEVASPPARYLQYRLTLHSDGEQTPTVMGLALRYLTPNMPPKVTSVKTEYPARPTSGGGGGGGGVGDPQPLHTMKISWEAMDPNADKITYTVEARDASAEDGAPFVTISKELTPNSYEWDTRTVADGRYILRITASDASDNVTDAALESSRRSDPVVVDNTPPAIENLEASPVAGRTIELQADLSDALTAIAEVRYRVGGSDDWVLVLPADLIYDSTSERVSVKIRGLSPGAVNVTLRATDALGNSRYASTTLTVE